MTEKQELFNIIRMALLVQIIFLLVSTLWFYSLYRITDERIQQQNIINQQQELLEKYVVFNKPVQQEITPLSKVLYFYFSIGFLCLLITFNTAYKYFTKYLEHKQEVEV